ncbi:MAG: hypothetical protein H7Y38_14215 [Armatimonadetes bacterium]|nr:hypothetical protein [Armatimonadota bacterium]
MAIFRNAATGTGAAIGCAAATGGGVATVCGAGGVLCQPPIGASPAGIPSFP